MTVCAHDFAMKALEFRSDFDAVRSLQVSTFAKNCSFSSLEGDTINGFK